MHSSSTLELKPWAQRLGVSVEGYELIQHHPRKGLYPMAYLNYVRTVLQKPRKLPVQQPAVRQPADYLFKRITGKLLHDEHRLSLLPPLLAEVQDIYEVPGPIAKLNE